MKHSRVMLILWIVCALAAGSPWAQEVFSPADLIQLRSATEAKISPDGKWIAGVVSRQRPAGDEPGGNYAELHVWDAATGESRPYVTGKVAVRAVQWSPDGKRIAFLQKRGDKDKTQVWALPLDGGEAVALTKSATDVQDFRWHPSGGRLAYIAPAAPTAREKELDKQGYGFVFYEENLKPRILYLQEAPGGGTVPEAQALTTDLSVWRAEWRPDGKALAVSTTPKNLVDQEYMAQVIQLLDPETQSTEAAGRSAGQAGQLRLEPRRRPDRLRGREGAQRPRRQPALRGGRCRRRAAQPDAGGIPRACELGGLAGRRHSGVSVGRGRLEHPGRRQPAGRAAARRVVRAGVWAGARHPLGRARTGSGGRCSDRPPPARRTFTCGKARPSRAACRT